MTEKHDYKNSSYNEEQVLMLATQAAEAYNNPILSIVFQMILVEAQRKIDEAPPDHVKEVMWNKQMRQIAGVFAHKLKEFKTEGERILADRQEKLSPDYQEQRRLDEQGFGLNFGQGGANG